VPVTSAPWRPGDQRVFIADIRRAAADLDWRQPFPQAGNFRLYDWDPEK
jgi:CDP-paratose 2-epimerase